MPDSFAERMSKRGVRADTRLLGDFTAIYCRGNHQGVARAPLASEGVDAGVYGRRVPSVCDECAELLRYAEWRRAMCPKEPKPFCSDCDTHCYKPGMRDAMREVMRYSGPRAMFRGYAIQGIRHLIQNRRARRAALPGTDARDG
jgi:hypothetical protein